jgi:hypothetical protein
MSAKKIPEWGDTGIPKSLVGLTDDSSADVSAVRSSHVNPSDVSLAILRKSAAAFGLTLCCRCSRCKAPLWNSRSVATRLGPVCRKRVPE